MNANGIKFGNRQEEISTISRNLKGVAKELDIPIIALSQLNRGVEGRDGYEGKRPILADLRESGAIEQDADIVCFIHRPEYYKIYEDNNHNDLHGIAEIIIAKHRNGGVGDVRLSFRSDLALFDNIGSGETSHGGRKARVERSKMNDEPLPPDDPLGASPDAGEVPY